MPVFETEDDRHRRLRALGAGVLADGERMRIGMLLADSAAPSGSHLKDTAMTVNINDTLQRIPSEARHKMRHAIGYMNDANPSVAESGIANAAGIRARMAMLRGDFGGGGAAGMVTDTEKSDLTVAIEYLDGVVAATRQRLAGGGR